MAAILLSTLNARYIHSSLGLRYLKANMGDLEQETHIVEFIINTRPIDIVETLLNQNASIIGFGVYIWNIEQTTQVITLLKQIKPDVMIVIGGPEVSYEYHEQSIAQLADYVICGYADFSFAELCHELLNDNPPTHRIITSLPFPVAQLHFPYQYYTEEDIAHRVLYVEASRGCPFKCQFCLSALDKTAWPFDTEQFLGEMKKLFDRGARHFKFVDRTFNLNVKVSIKILKFFLDLLENHKLFLHFELIPDQLPEPLKAIIQDFPEGVLQFEIGIQSFNPSVQQTISRKQNNEATKNNLQWIRSETTAHIHADLIVGLPGEDVTSFAEGFNSLVELDPHEIQVGILKRLRGTPIIQHTAGYGMVYNPLPPYNILCSDLIDFPTMQRLVRFARYWDMIANSGRFYATKPMLLADNPFERFMRFSDWLFQTTQQTHKISLPRLFELLYQGLTDALQIPHHVVCDALWLDFQRSGLKGLPSFIDKDKIKKTTASKKISGATVLSRQTQHMLGQNS